MAICNRMPLDASSAINLTFQWLGWTARDLRDVGYPVDHAAELDDRAVAGALDDASAVHGDDRVDQVAAQRPQPRKRTLLVGAGELAIAGDVGHQNRRQFPGLAHGAPLGRRQDSTKWAARGRSRSRQVERPGLPTSAPARPAPDKI
jgi:hypothetical protein